MPPPLRSKSFPYGLPGLSHRQKDDCNMGTILMARAVGMVDTIHRAERCSKVPSFATLENPPPSEHEEHISAWHMPEVVELVDKIEEWQCAHFHTCAYQSGLEPGTKHFKPQLVGGTLPGIGTLSRKCSCGNRPHEPIIGKDRSKKSAAYPWDFCKAYGELAAKHFRNMAKTEFLEGRLVILEDRINYLKSNTTKVMNEVEGLEKETRKVEGSSEYRSGLEHKRKRPREPTPENKEEERSASWDPSEGVDWSRSSSQERNVEEREPSRSASSHAGGRTAVELKANKEVSEEKRSEEPKEALAWTGGHGKHGLLREPKAKSEIPAALTYLGGMRDPHRAVVKLPTLQSQGLKLWERWRKFAT